MVKRMRKHSDEPPEETANINDESLREENTSNVCNVKSFYGNKKVNLRWTTPKLNETKKIPLELEQKDESVSCGSVESNESSCLKSSTESYNGTSCKQRARIVYKHENDIFWTSNIYGKKRRTEQTKTPTKTFQQHAVRHSPRLKCKTIVSKECTSPISNNSCHKEIAPDLLGNKAHQYSPISTSVSPSKKINEWGQYKTTASCSVETQTSFSLSSQDSDCRTNSSPMCFVRSSPVVNQQQQRQQPLVESPLSLNQSVGQEELSESSDDSEPYEMFNLDSSSYLNSSLRSDSSCPSPSKKTPKKRQEKTLLSYFSKVDNQQTRLGGSNNKQKTSDVQITNEKRRKKKPAKTQMQFSKSGLSPKAESPRYHLVYFCNLW